jgi:hypothetical protein
MRWLLPEPKSFDALATNLRLLKVLRESCPVRQFL